MICENCESEMFIDSWNGWIWTCCNCGYIGRPATDVEIKKEERFLEKNKNELNIRKQKMHEARTMRALNSFAGR